MDLRESRIAISTRIKVFLDTLYAFISGYWIKYSKQHCWICCTDTEYNMEPTQSIWFGTLNKSIASVLPFIPLCTREEGAITFNRHRDSCVTRARSPLHCDLMCFWWLQQHSPRLVTILPGPNIESSQLQLWSWSHGVTLSPAQHTIVCCGKADGTEAAVNESYSTF